MRVLQNAKLKDIVSAPLNNAKSILFFQDVQEHTQVLIEAALEHLITKQRAPQWNDLPVVTLAVPLPTADWAGCCTFALRLL